MADFETPRWFQADQPVEAALVDADETFVESLACDEPVVTAPVDHQLASLLRSWRAEVVRDHDGLHGSGVGAGEELPEWARRVVREHSAASAELDGAVEQMVAATFHSFDPSVVSARKRLAAAHEALQGSGRVEPGVFGEVEAREAAAEATMAKAAADRARVEREREEWRARFERADWVAPYDTADGMKAGEACPGWRCPDPECGQVEPNGFLLSINHGFDPEEPGSGIWNGRCSKVHLHSAPACPDCCGRVLVGAADCGARRAAGGVGGCPVTARRGPVVIARRRSRHGRWRSVVVAAALVVLFLCGLVGGVVGAVGAWSGGSPWSAGVWLMVAAVAAVMALVVIAVLFAPVNTSAWGEPAGDPADAARFWVDANPWFREDDGPGASGGDAE